MNTALIIHVDFGRVTDRRAIAAAYEAIERVLPFMDRENAEETRAALRAIAEELEREQVPLPSRRHFLS